MDMIEESLDVPLSATLQVVASATPAGLELAVYEAAAQSYLWIVVSSFHVLPSHSSLDLLARDSETNPNICPSNGSLSID
jgi:hypothetical protein